jgi:hypothetical protein
MGRGVTKFFCFPLLELGAVCDPEGNYICPCARGLKCEESSPSAGPRKSTPKMSKKHQLKHGDMARVILDEGCECPRLDKKSKLEEEEGKYRVAVCQPDRNRSRANVTDPCDRSPVKATIKPCDFVECNNHSDCDEDECCLEVTRKEARHHKNHNNNAITFCFPHLDEAMACDINQKWSCPCRRGLNCIRGKHDPKKDYRPTVTWNEGEECPTLYKEPSPKPDKHVPTCQQLTSSHVRDHNQERPERHSSERHNSKGQCPGGRKSGLRHGPTAQKHSPEKPRPTKPGPQKPRPKNHGPEKPTPAKPGPEKPRTEKHGPAKTGHGPNEHK